MTSESHLLGDRVRKSDWSNRITLIFFSGSANTTVYIALWFIEIMKYEHTTEDKQFLAAMAIAEGMSRTKFATKFGIPVYEATLIYQRVESDAS